MWEGEGAERGPLSLVQSSAALNHPNRLAMPNPHSAPWALRNATQANIQT